MLATGLTAQARVSTHSRPKAAAVHFFILFFVANVFQHTAARRRLLIRKLLGLDIRQFQHTAARRRLQATTSPLSPNAGFQHTAARRRLLKQNCSLVG